MSFADELADRFVDGSSVDWRGLGQTFVGSLFLAVSMAWGALTLTIGDGIHGLIIGLAGFWADLVDVVIGTPEAALSGATSAAVAFVSGSGPVGFVVAVALVLLTLYLLAEVYGDE